MIYNTVAVFLGGGIGATLRYLISSLSRTVFKAPILGTLTVNLVGCFLMGYISGLTLGKLNTISPTLKSFITIGFLGGLTTFSTFIFEEFELIKNSKETIALLYMAGSYILSLMLIFAGYHIAKP